MKLASKINQFKRGGIYFISKTIFQEINGYSNEYYGWGGEDVDLQVRAELYNIKINRDTFVDRRNNNHYFDDISSSPNSKHKSKIIRANKKHIKIPLYKKDRNNIQKDGLNTCTYKIVKEQNNYNNNPNIKRILVDI